MAWNKPSESGEAISRSLHKKSSLKRSGDRFSVKGAVTGAIIVLGAAVAAWWLWPNASAPVAEDGDGTVERRIREVTPAAASQIAEEKAEEKSVPYWERPTTNGLTKCQIEGWKQFRRPPPRYTNTYFVARKPEPFEIFPTRAENEIAMLLTVEPGTPMIGTPDYGAWFKEEFLKSCETPIIVSPQDDSYRRELKKMMNAAKIELRQRMADGEDIGKIMEDSRNELQRLGIVRQQLENDARDLIEKSAQSGSDIDDCVKALNKMLEDKGMAPFEMTPIMKQRLMRRLGIESEE